MKSLLLLVDFQEDFLCRRGLRPCSGEVVDQAARLLDRWREKGNPVAHIRMTVSNEGTDHLPHWKSPGKRHCVDGTSGHSVPIALREVKGEAVIHKTGYSAPGLVSFVGKSGVNRVIVAGLLLHACVRQAVTDLFQSGIEVVVADDAVASDDPIHAAVTRRYFEDRGISFSSSDSIIGCLDHASDLRHDSADAAHLDTIIKRASGFFRIWALTPFQEKANAVIRLANALSGAGRSLALRITAETGKPIRFAESEVSRSIEMAEAIVRRFDRFPDEIRSGAPYVRRVPHGVMAIITPWNNPVYLPLGKIIPAILAGNTVVWKPAPEANGIAQAILDLLISSEFPPDLIQLVSGDAMTGRLIMTHPGVDAATMTASDAAGFSASEVCGNRRIPLQAELGGNNAAIILADADLTLAASKVAAGAFEMAGQRCTANRRAIVEKECLDDFMDLLKESMSKLTRGNPLDPETVVGPLVNPIRKTRIEGVIRRALADGHTVFQLPDNGQSADPSELPPTLVCCDDPSHEIVQEETFGPVLVIQAADNLDEAIAHCNGVRQGLAASIFSTNSDNIGRFLREAKAGILKVNASTADASVDLPFGGWKTSGIGPAEHGDADLEFYLRLQTLYT